MINFFYGDNVLIFTGGNDTVPDGFTVVPAVGSFAKMIENLEKYKRLAVEAENPEGACKRFIRNFRPVDAAGGVVENPGGEVLMIRRNRRWDLPKGHREQGESFHFCAVREVEEETGITATVNGAEPVVTTYHFYRNRGLWEIKKTEWYGMQYVSGTPEPQVIEGISSVEWVSRDDVAVKAQSCFPSVREVLKASGLLPSRS